MYNKIARMASLIAFIVIGHFKSRRTRYSTAKVVVSVALNYLFYSALHGIEYISRDILLNYVEHVLILYKLALVSLV